jgi:hypothetical protein
MNARRERPPCAWPCKKRPPKKEASFFAWGQAGRQSPRTAPNHPKDTAPLSSFTREGGEKKKRKSHRYFFFFFVPLLALPSWILAREEKKKKTPPPSSPPTPGDERQREKKKKKRVENNVEMPRILFFFFHLHLFFLLPKKKKKGKTGGFPLKQLAFSDGPWGTPFLGRPGRAAQAWRS